MTEFKVPPPEGYEESCEPNDDGWPVWITKDGGSCPSCDEVENLDADADEDTRLFALECPECSEPGCNLCFPDGRGCVCPTCE